MLYEINSDGYSAVIDMLHGANCISLKSTDRGINILRPRGEEIPDNPYLYGMPLLFPVNRLSEGKFSFDGRDYLFPINEPSTGCHLHGSLHLLPFELKEKSESTLTAEYVSDSTRRYHGYPNDFKISLKYSLSASGLETAVTITNLSDIKMPVMLGHHTTFSTELASGDARIFAEADSYYERDPKTYLPINKNASPSEPDADVCAILDGSLLIDGRVISKHLRASGRIMTLTSKINRLRMVYESDPVYRFRLIYSNSKDYVCLEPQTCLVDAPNLSAAEDDTGFHYIEPHDSKEYTSKIYLTEVIPL